MLIALILVIVGLTVVYLAPRTLPCAPDEASRFGAVLVAGFMARIVSSLFLRDLPLFSHGFGAQGDAGVYERAAWSVAQLWQYVGIQWISADQIDTPSASNAMLAVHMYAVVTYLNGGEMSVLGCVALNAILACGTCIELARLGMLIGGSTRDSQLVATLTLFSPGFVFHTSDLFKDGLSAFLVVAAVVQCFRLAQRIDLIAFVVGGLALFLLWFVRYYLVFLVSAPLVIALLGVRSQSTARPIVAFVAVIAGALVLAGSQFGEDALDVGVSTFEHATSWEAQSFNALGGSGVRFDDSQPLLSIPLRILYTLFSPFPWDFRSTSIGFQVGKVDAILWYVLLYHAVRAGREMWRTDRGTLLMFLVVLVPLTIAYALTVANIGLILRQRMPIVMLGSVLAVRDPRGLFVRRAPEAALA